MRNSFWAGVVICALIIPASASAHPHLRSSDPAAGSHITGPLHKVTLVFSEKVEAGMTHLLLLDSSRDTVNVSGFRSVGNGLTQEAAISPGLGAGSYTAIWTCMGTDGHGMKGRFTFDITEQDSVATPPASAAPVQPEKPAPGNSNVDMHSEEMAANSGGIAGALGRTVTFAGVVLLLGSAAFYFLVLPSSGLPVADAKEVTSRIRLVALGGAVLVLVFALARVVVQANTMSASGAGSVSALQMLTGTQWGAQMEILITASGVAVGAMLMARYSKVAWAVAALMGIVSAVALALSGHAGSVEQLRFAAIAADVLHLIAVSCWIGSLVALLCGALPVAFRTGRNENWIIVSQTVRAFSSVAMASMVVLVATGAFSGWIQLHQLGNLFSTTYGRVLLLKVGLFGVTAAVGFYNYRVVTPGLGSFEGTSRLARSARAEVAVAALILVVTGFLTGLSTV